jgi:hypothetical protein
MIARELLVEGVALDGLAKSFRPRKLGIRAVDMSVLNIVFGVAIRTIDVSYIVDHAIQQVIGGWLVFGAIVGLTF